MRRRSVLASRSVLLLSVLYRSLSNTKITTSAFSPATSVAITAKRPRSVKAFMEEHNDNDPLPSPVRVVSFDLDNCLWKTSATIEAANDSLAEFLLEFVEKNDTPPRRVETIMGQLFKENKADYCPIDTDTAKAPVLLTKLRKDAIRAWLARENQTETEIDDLDAVDKTLVDQAFDIWTTARHDTIPDHMANNVLSTLEHLSNLEPPVLICAVTDGNSNPLSLPKIGPYFHFCVNAEMVGVSKPDKRLYLQAAKEASSRLSDLQSKTTMEMLEDGLGPWWVHVGDDFVKDVVAAKSLSMRTIWSRELVREKYRVPVETTTAMPQRTVEDLVRDVSSNKVLQMEIGADDYLETSLQKEFSDAIVDEFRLIGKIVEQWQTEAMETADKGVVTDVANDGSVESFLEVVLPENYNGPHPSTTLENNVSSGKGPAGEDFKFCMECGEKLPSIAKFCSSCGAKQ